ncbi:MAG: hypothetical protein NTW10_05460 [Bacteroidetes bacterium]|nr:hypothetical protein [Bacteroidota bacterium]
MNKTTSLAHAQRAIAISNWLKHYPAHLLSAEDYLWLMLNQQIFINRASGFDEVGILKGPWGKAYQSLKDKGDIQLFDFDLKSEYFNQRFRVLEESQTYHDPDHQIKNDLSSLIFCDINHVPVGLNYDDFFNHTGNRDGYNFFTNFARAYTEYADFVEKKHETGIVDFTGRTEFLLSFNISVDVPHQKSKITNKIITDKKLELQQTYDMFDPEFRPSFDQFVVGNLPHKCYVDISPADFIRLKENSEYLVIRDKYQQLQREITTKEKLLEFQNEQKDHPTSPTGSPADWHVQEIRLNHLKYRTHDIPHEHRYCNQRIISNKRILNGSHWLFSLQHLQPTLKSIESGTTF